MHDIKCVDVTWIKGVDIEYGNVMNNHIHLLRWIYIIIIKCVEVLSLTIGGEWYWLIVEGVICAMCCW